MLAISKEFVITDIVERIKFIREGKELSQAKFAAMIDSSQGNVGDWERGRSLPSITALMAIVKRFDVSADWLLFGNNDNRKNDYQISNNLSLEVSFKDRLKKLREEKGLSQAKFASIIDVSPGNVGDWESERAAPGATALTNIANAFNVSIDWLLQGEASDNLISIGDDEELGLLDIPNRIKYLRDKHDLSQAKFANIINVSPGNIAAWEKPGGVLPGAKALINIARNFDISIDWILLGDEIPRKDTPDDELYKLILQFNDEDKSELKTFIGYLQHRKVKEENLFYISPKPTDFKVAENDLIEEKAAYADEFYIPLLGASAAGKPILINEVLEGYLPICKKISSQKAFAVRARGDSMIGAGIEDGDLVVVKHQPIVEHGEIALFRINDESTIKYFAPQGSDIFLMPANQKYKPIPVHPKDTFAIIGKVIQVIKKEEAEKKLRHFHEE